MSERPTSPLANTITYFNLRPHKYADDEYLRLLEPANGLAQEIFRLKLATRLHRNRYLQPVSEVGEMKQMAVDVTRAFRRNRVVLDNMTSLVDAILDPSHPLLTSYREVNQAAKRAARRFRYSRYTTEQIQAVVLTGIPEDVLRAIPESMYMVRHDLRTPITAVDVRAQIIARSLSPDTILEGHLALRRDLRGLDRLLFTLDERMLGVYLRYPTVLDALEIIDDTFPANGNLDLLNQSRRIWFPYVTLEHDLPKNVLDRILSTPESDLAELLATIKQNAFRARDVRNRDPMRSQEPMEIMISTRSNPVVDGVVITIADNLIGFPLHLLGEEFEPGVSGFGGLGKGLAHAATNIKKAGGSLFKRNVEVGVGAVQEIAIPFRPGR